MKSRGRFSAGERGPGRRVGAPAAEAGSHGNALLDSGSPTRGDSGGLRERLESATYERVVRETLDRQGVRGLELDVVREVDPLKQSDELVPSVLARWTDDEREVDLGV